MPRNFNAEREKRDTKVLGSAFRIPRSALEIRAGADAARRPDGKCHREHTAF